jgi:hypothetical protein
MAATGGTVHWGFFGHDAAGSLQALDGKEAQRP